MNNHHLHSLSSFIGLFLACTFHIVAQDAGNALHFQNDNNKTSGDFLSCGSPNYELKEKLTVAAWVRWTADPSSPSIIKQKDDKAAGRLWSRWISIMPPMKDNSGCSITLTTLHLNGLSTPATGWPYNLQPHPHSMNGSMSSVSMTVMQRHRCVYISTACWKRPQTIPGSMEIFQDTPKNFG